MPISQRVIGLCALCAVAAPAAAIPTPRHDGKPFYQSHPERMAAVKEAFQISWDGYYNNAFPHDSLKPISNSYSDDRNGWGASAVDAISTALVMENKEAVEQILEHVQNIDFDTAVGDISVFETTIRYLGGLLSGYDLLTGPLATLGVDETLVDGLLSQATHLADNLKVAFDTPTGIPDNIVNFDPPRRNGSESSGIATIGTLVLEWTRLSDLTGDPLYGALAQTGQSYLMDPQPQELAEPFPGLIGTNVNITDGQFLDGEGGWIGGDDSFYEYLLKMYIYDPDRFESYKDRWVLAVESSIEYLASHPKSRPDLTFLSSFDGPTPVLESQHLACFDAGNIILGGLYLDEPRYVDFGLELTASCHDTYISTQTRIGPESFKWQDDGRLVPVGASGNEDAPTDQAEFYAASGFWIDDSEYMLRPEVIESYYYAYRATGDPKYQDWAWDAFLAVNTTCAVGSGYSTISDVNAPNGGGFQDFQESFWFAEVLKYFYMIQADDAPFQIQADTSEDYVFNTECHPIKKYLEEE